MKKTFHLQNRFHLFFTTFFYFIIRVRNCGFFILSISLALITSPSLNAEEEMAGNNTETEIELDENTYIGFFIGSGRVYNEHVDTEGFANWGHPGSVADYDETNPVGGMLVGKRIRINGVPLRLELDGTVGNMSASTNKLDPQGLDETARSDISWIVTARAGLEHQLGPATLFTNGGLAVARISNSVIDIDFSPDKPPQEDPDDSFSDNSIHVGWVIGAGAEVPLGKNGNAKLLRDDKGWVLRLEGSYIDFGEDTYEVNHSGGNRCGPGGLHKPCLYNIENKIGIVRLAIIKRF